MTMRQVKMTIAYVLSGMLEVDLDIATLSDDDLDILHDLLSMREAANTDADQ